MTINPVARGIQSVYSTKLACQLETITQTDRGKWLVDSEVKHNSYGIYFLNNYPLFFGVPTINSSNMYVCWQRWQQFPLTESDKTVLNRSCYMNMAITDEATSFECPNQDLEVANVVNVEINARDLKKLDVAYVLTQRNLVAFSGDEVTFELCGEGNGVRIYHVNYTE
jgi:hypothetical protein